MQKMTIFAAMKKALCILALMLLFLTSCAGAKVKQYKLQVVKEYPHDVSSYTQGLFFEGDKLYESTGLYGKSTFRMVDLQTGNALRKLDFGSKYFVEGSVMLNGNLYILTWENKVAFVYDAETLEYKTSYSYPREGWGLTTDGKQLIASDGSSRLYFMDENFKVERTVTVVLNGKQVRYLNELEYIDGKVWANVYTTDMILVINPKTGEAEASIDCTGLLSKSLRDSDTDVLNGIAYKKDTDQIFLTGKNWKRLYEVKLVEQK